MIGVVEGEVPWVEKYRPQKVEDCILPERIKKTFQSFVDSGRIPNIILSGPPGSGKTTIAKAMCKELDMSVMFIPSSVERGMDTLRAKIVTYASSSSITGAGKAIILDEADNVTFDAQEALRNVIETFSNNCSFILTCNNKSRLIEPIHSRTSVIDFSLRSEEKPKLALEFYKRTAEILKHENVSFNKEVLRNLVMKFFPDFRRTLNELQRFALLGDIDTSVLSQIEEILNLDDLIRTLKDQDFSAMRKWVANNSDISHTLLFRAVYDALYNFMKPASIPLAVIIVGKYQYQSSFVNDQEINTVACFTELMTECEFLE